MLEERSAWPQIRGALAGPGARIAALLFLLAVAVRGLFLLEMASSPAFRIPLVDAETYDALARQLALGRHLSRDFFWQPPLYPLLLSLVYLVTGGSMLAAKMAQALLGGATCVLTYVLGHAILGRRAGAIAGVVVALYMPLVFFECDLLAAGLAAFWSLVLILLLMESGERPSFRVLLALGFCSALAVLTRPTFLPFVAAAGLWLALGAYRRAGARGAASRCAIAIFGFALAALPAAAVNATRMTGSFTILPSSGGINFYIGNNPNICETLTARPGWDWTKLTTLPHREGFERRSEQQAFFYRKVANYLKREPSGFLANLGRKGARILCSRELPRNVDPYVFRQWSHLLSLLFWKAGPFGFPFGLLLPLAVVGAWGFRRQVPFVIWLFLGLFSIALVAVFVADRYRAPMAPVLSILAAGGILRLIEMARARRTKALLASAASIAAVTLVSSLPGPFCEEKLDYAADLDLMLGIAHFQRAQVAADTTLAGQETRLAERYYRKSIAANPLLADGHSELGNLHFVSGRFKEAAESYVRALELRPDHGKALHSLGVLLFRAGKDNDAIDCFRRALALDPSFPRTYLFLGQALLHKGQIREAIGQIEKGLLLETDPDYRALAMSCLAEARARSGPSGP
ncbi:MAG: tetratricopeptide repeat protein [Candidatus Eisenbacteria bacterium]|nr:tetratricopeptide repeat protein [Candidatus Eisenbacteria bacterium]